MSKCLQAALVLGLIVTLAALSSCTPNAVSGESAVAPPPDKATAARIAASAKMAMDKNPADWAAMVAFLADAEPLVRRHGIYGLERLGDPAAGKLILPLAKDKDLWVQRTAIVALGKLKVREAVPVLLGLLSDKNEYVRYEAFVALGRIGDPASQPAITKALRDKQAWATVDVWNQVDILRVVDRPFFSDRAIIPVLKDVLGYKTWNLPNLDATTPQNRARVALMIANCAAVILADKFGDPSGEDVLIEGLANKTDEYMQQSSALALGAIKSKKAIPEIIKMMNQSEWQTNKRYALAALAQIAAPADQAVVMPAIKPYLTSQDRRLFEPAQLVLTKIDPSVKPAAFVEPPAAKEPLFLPNELNVPGGRKPPQFICLGVDDCVNIEGLEAMLDICETLRANGSKAVFTMWVAPLMADYKHRDIDKETMLLQRLFDLGCEMANHTLHHNPGGKFWTSLPKEQQVEEIEGNVQWFRENVAGYTRPFTYKGGGGSTSGGQPDPEFTKQLMARQRFLYRGRDGSTDPSQQTWPTGPKQEGAMWIINTGLMDRAAPPVHATIVNVTRSDYSGRFDYEVPQGVAMWKANLDYHYDNPRRPVLALNAFHDWAFKGLLDPAAGKGSHRNEGPILKAFLMDVLVTNKAKYPDLHCVTLRQVVEYALSDGDLKHTLAAGNCQDSRNPEKPKVE